MKFTKYYSIKNKTPRNVGWGSLKFGDLITPYSLCNSFNSDGLLYDVWKPYLCFEHVITTIHFHKKVNDKVLTKQILKGFKDFRVEWI